MGHPHPWCVVGLLLAGVAPFAAAGDLVVRVETAAGAPVEDAVVYAVPESHLPGSAHLRSTIDQVNRQFIPRINVVQAGTSVSFPNSDNIRHSVYSFSAAKTFTLKLYAGRSAAPVLFDKPGLVVLGCNIHDIMVAYLMVVDTPYFARTDHGGSVTLTKLAPGNYTLRAWHTPLSESQQVSESLRIEAGADSTRRTLRIAAPLDAPGTAAAPR